MIERYQAAFILLLVLVFQSKYWGGGYFLHAINIPFQLTSTLIHEIGHGMAAVITGGFSHRIELGSFGGLSYSTGGWRGLVLFGGYASPPLIGTLLFISISRSFEKSLLLIPKIIVILLGVSALLWVRDPITFLVMIVIYSVFRMLTKIEQRYQVKSFLTFVALYMIGEGFTSPYFSGLETYSTKSDAFQLAILYPGTPLTWVWIWWGWTTLLCIACFWLAREDAIDEAFEEWEEDNEKNKFSDKEL